MLHPSLEVENHVSAELISKMKLLTKGTYCLEIHSAAAILARTQTSEWLFLYFPVHRFLWVLLSSVEALTPVHRMLAATPSSQFPELD